MDEQDNEDCGNDDIAEGMKHDLNEVRNKNTASNEEMQYDDSEPIIRKINPEENVTLSQLNWAFAGEQRMIETEMVDGVRKQPLQQKATNSIRPFHSLKLMLKRNNSGNYDADKDANSNEAKKTILDAGKESADHEIDAVPLISVTPTLENKHKEESVAALKSNADGKKTENKIEQQKKAETNEEPEKNGRGKTKKEMIKAQKDPMKKAEPKTVKENVIVKEKRTVKPSNGMKSPFYDRKVHILQKWNEAEMKLVEYMWSVRNPEG